MIEVLKAGPLATVQDLGRYGYRKYGAPVSGAMDMYSARVGNILVGNPQDAALVEITYGLTRIRTDEEVYLAVTGGDLSPSVNGAAVSMTQAQRDIKRKLKVLE